ncbi:hypothetical protein TNCV_95241 [Trichonephila clavipes]|nr:hypothetical protein TNCV_95241 [Trichonephila clavipes]
MFDSSSYDNPTPLADADASRDVFPRGGTSQDVSRKFPELNLIERIWTIIERLFCAQKSCNGNFFTIMDGCEGNKSKYFFRDFRRLVETIPCQIAVIHQLKGCGSRMVKVSDRSWPCHEFEPSTTKDPPCRAAIHVKSVES